MPFCRNGQVILGTWTATTGFVPPPNVGPDGSSRRSYPASPHQYVVCGPDTRGQRQLDCHTLCPDQWAEAAPPQLEQATTRLKALHPPLPTASPMGLPLYHNCAIPRAMTELGEYGSKVLGRWFHWQPLRRKIIPLRIGLTRLRPVVLGGVPSRITGSTFSHKSSGSEERGIRD